MGGPYRKPTCWRTSAPWFACLAGECPGHPEHPVHAALAGDVEGPDGEPCWLTAIAAEYPDGLCTALAIGFRDCRTMPDPLPLIRVDEMGTHDPLAAPSKKQIREAENEKAIGGLRNPQSSRARIHGWNTLGREMAGRLEHIVEKHAAKFEEVLKNIGVEGASGIPAEIVEEAQQVLCDIVGIEAAQWDKQCVCSELLEALAHKAGNPELSAAAWPKTGTPLGIITEIPCYWIFLRVEPNSYEHQATVEEAAAWCRGSEFENYSSAKDNQARVEQELLRELELGYLDWFADRNVLEKDLGQLILSKIAAIISEKNGRFKNKLIHDLRVSLVNSMVSCPERVILPRIKDAVDGILKVIEGLTEGEGITQLVLDFSDAFKMLPVTTEERRFLAGTATLRGVKGFFAYRRILFGIVTGPLLWGRLAALVMRCTASLYPADTLALQCYVDDPLLAVRGTLKQRVTRLSVIVLLWSCFHLRLAWLKGALGMEVDWIGATLKVVEAKENTRANVVVSISAAHTLKVKQKAEAFLASNRCGRKALRDFAALTAWISHVILCLSAFSQMLWAACAAPPAATECERWLLTKRVSLPLAWFVQFAMEHWEPVARKCFANTSAIGPIVTFDASLTAGGAILHLGGNTEKPPDAWFEVTWTATDFLAIGAEKGVAAFQPHWEAYAMLLALWTWRQLLQAQNGPLMLRGDAFGVLQSIVARRAKQHSLNMLMAEAQLILGHSGYDLCAAHWWSERNITCDILSRLAEGFLIPSECQPEKRWRAQRRHWRVLPGGKAPLVHALA